MADNTTISSMSGGDVISTDDLASINSSPVTGVKVQRVKVGYGTDGQLTDVSPLNPMPVGQVGVGQVGLSEIDGNPVPQSAPGVTFNSLADALGGPIDEVNPLPIKLMPQASPVSVLPSNASDDTYTGSMGFTNNNIIWYLRRPCQSFTFVVSGTYNLQYGVYISYDGITFNQVAFSVGGLQVPTSNVSSGGGTQHYKIAASMAGVKAVRITNNGYTSGTMNVVGTASQMALSPMEIAAAFVGNGTNFGTNNYLPVNQSVPLLINGSSTFDLAKEVVNTLNTVGTGVAATGLLALLDETAPTAITENSFGALRMSANHALLAELRHPTITTYVANSDALAPAATATDVFLLNGSASKTIFIHWIKLSQTQTAAGTNKWLLVKRSTANSAGTSAAPTVIPLDSGNAAATAIMLAYTANPTPGTTVGTIDTANIVAPTTTSLLSPEKIWNFNDLLGQPLVLRGVAQGLAVNFNGAAIPGGLSVGCTICWSEADG